MSSLGNIFMYIGIVYWIFFAFRLLKNYTKIELTTLTKVGIVIVAIIVSLPASNIFSLYAIIYFHLLVINGILELFNLYFKKYPYFKKIVITGIASIIITIGLMGYGFYNMNHIIKTEYNLTSNKLDSLKILQITDLHMSNSISVKKLKEYCEEMSAEKADVVFLTGDIFDQHTSKEDMEEATKILGSISNTLGIYYVYGNHDGGGTAFNAQDIRDSFKEHGVRVLEDTTVMIGDLIMVGRKDARFHNDNEDRKTSQELLQYLPKDKYLIVLDHQPLDIEENAQWGVDLQLAGHTHGGQIFPMGPVEALLTGGLIYGERTIGDYHAITSSGISGWGYPIRTGASSEYVIININ
jgi:predicted MPP superfamily phosphohydrolase